MGRDGGGDGGRISQEPRETEKKSSRQKRKTEHNRDRKVTRRHKQGEVQTKKLKEIESDRKEAEQQGTDGEMEKQQVRWGPGLGWGDRGLTRTTPKMPTERFG